jgi:hypothetical protein
MYATPLLGGLWPALVFGGLFGAMMLALVIGGIVGILRCAPPRAPKPKPAETAPPEARLQPV